MRKERIFAKVCALDAVIIITINFANIETFFQILRHSAPRMRERGTEVVVGGGVEVSLWPPKLLLIVSSDGE